MKSRRKFNLSEFITLVLVWVVMMNLFTWFMLSVLEMFFTFSEIEHIVQENIIAKYLYSGYQYLESSLFGLVFGCFFALINHLTDSLSYFRNSFGRVILFRTLLYMLALITASGIIFGILLNIGVLPDEFVNVEFTRIFTFSTVTSMLFFVFSCILFINFVQQVSRKFGPGNMLRMITGKYAKPREEQRIFMFIDLNDSTTIAERLGHIKYSALLKDCFHDLTNTVLKYNADIYQYVGDEVVLSWRISKGLDESNCLKTFFAFDHFLASRKKYYEENYGQLPEFKAGLDMGTVTVTEIGDIKREIAYHGDVLNTASRIQHLCKENHEKMMISEKLATHLQVSKLFTKKLVGEINLRGKKSVTNLYSVSYNN